MNSRPAPLTGFDTESPGFARPWPAIESLAGETWDEVVQERLATPLDAPDALGRVPALAGQLTRILLRPGEALERVCLEAPQLVIFAADHGLADEGVSAFPQSATLQRAQRVLQGRAPVNALAELHGFEITLVDAGVASHIEAIKGDSPEVPLQLRKIGYGTRNMVLNQAMSTAQALSAIQAGMDVVRHLPGNVVALGHISVAGNACAAQLLSRLCGVPLADACGRDQADDNVRAQHRLERLFAAASRHRKATAPLDVLATLGGFEVAMACGAILQAASERRVIVIDSFVIGAAALVARALVPAVVDYLVFAHRSAEPGHRLLLIHLQARPLLDMELRTGQGVGALMAWPLLVAALRLLQTR